MDFEGIIKGAIKHNNAIVLKRKEIISYIETLEDKPNVNQLFKIMEKYKMARGQYDVSTLADEVGNGMVPLKDPLYVPFGCFNELKMILEKKMFYPLLLSGLSGTGKTKMVEQVCASLSRQLVRVNLTIESDEDSLIGGWKLENGSMQYRKGPVIDAMERGAVLLLDEVDLASPSRIMCLQSIMEGVGYFIKKTGEFVKPAAGFTVIATANTKGTGDDSGSFVATNILNEAFLERFAILFECGYPPEKVEKDILGKLLVRHNMADDDGKDFADILVKTANAIRKAYDAEGDIRHTLSTRRLVHIINSYAIFDRDREKALTVCFSRFDKAHQEAFMSTYKQHCPTTKTEEDELKAETFTTDPFELKAFPS